MSTRLSVCLLTRDEERNIERAIRSVEGLADEVIVADTGSTDRTAEIARSLGAEVLPFAWDDDFSAGRNFALDRAKGEWILWLNPDEELVPQGRDRVRSLISSPDRVFGHLVTIRSQSRQDRPDQFSETFDLRLFRARPDVRYVGRLHPHIPDATLRAVAQEGEQVRLSEVIIRHHAYMSTLDPSKVRWAIRLLEKELRDRPGQLPYLIDYGRNLLLLDDPRGHDVLAQAIEMILPVLNDPVAPDPSVQLLLEYVLRIPADRNRSRMTSAQALDLAPNWFPSSPPLLWTMAEIYFRERQHGAAAVLLERLVQLGVTGAYDHTRAFDPRIVGPRALRNLGQCYLALGRNAEARRIFESLFSDRDCGPESAKILEELDDTKV